MLKGSSKPDDEKENWKGNSSGKRQAAADRRKKIIETLRDQGHMNLENAFPGTARASLDADLLHLKKLGLDFHKQGKIIRNAAVVGAASDLENVNTEAKELVAGLTVSLLIGFPKEDEKKAQRRISNGDVKTQPGAPKRTPGFLYIQEIYEKLRLCGSRREPSDRAEPSALDKARAIRLKLQRYFEEASRMIALDSGTTNLRISQKLATSGKVPIKGTTVTELCVTTNSRLIFQNIGAPDESDTFIRCIIIGGQQRGRTPTIAGALAEVFLRNSSLRFGISILGATYVAVGSGSGLVYSHSQEEAILKGIFFEKSTLRVVAVDNSKISVDVMRGGYAFCSIEPDQLDLIITNAPLKNIEDKGNEQDRINEFRANILAIEERGIPVLVAESAETLPW